MFDMKDHEILNEAANNIIYQRGVQYYRLGRVTHYIFDENNWFAKAIVQGSEAYKVQVELDEDGDIGDYECTCPAYSNYYGACKHIVAVLKKVQHEFKNKYSVQYENEKAAQELFDFFDSVGYVEQSIREEVNLEVALEIERDYKDMLYSIELKVGNERLYSVRKSSDFIKCINDGGTIEYGKKFIFDTKQHYFSDKNAEIIRALSEMYEQERALKSHRYHYGEATAFKGKKTYLSLLIFKKILQILEGITVSITIFGHCYQNIRIVENNIPLHFSLTRSGEKICLDIEERNDIVCITEDGSYFFYKGNICKIPKEHKMQFLSLYNAFVRTKGNPISFGENLRERLVSEVFPALKELGDVKVDKSVEEQIYYEKLIPKIYFDRVNEGIGARVEFIYGEYLVNPFDGKISNTYNDKILARDVKQEKEIMGFFEKGEFSVERGKIYLEDEEKIYNFIYELLPRLQEKADVYYSEDFKNIKISRPRSFSGGVRVNPDSDLLEFSFELDGVGADELEDIFAAVKLKKKYHRLKDGSFIPLENSELDSAAKLVENLELGMKDLKDGVISMPKHRALYIDNYLRDAALKGVERNRDFKQLVQNVLEPQDMDFKVPEELKHILRDYQKIGFKWLKTLAGYGFGGILADDMGLGKTLQVITFVMSEREKRGKPSLVVAPTSLIYNWQDEIQKFAPTLNSMVISGMPKEREQQIKNVGDVDFVITSYPLIRRDIELYKKKKFAFCFLDEAQHIKNPNTINAKNVKQVNADGYFALTGTPIENSLTELWSVFDYVMPGYLFGHNKFVKRYESPIVKSGDEDALKDLGRQIRPFVLRRMKRDVLKELPPKIETKMSAEMNTEQKKIYAAYLQQAKRDLATELSQNGFEKSQIKILAMLTRLRQICCHPALFIDNYAGESGKLDLLNEILEDAFESGHRVLLFSQFTSMLGIIRSELETQGVEHFYLDGSTKVQDRGSMVREFNDGKAKIFLISLKAGGTGLNLTGADMVIHFDPWWNPAVEDQATDRAYRIGQMNTVQVFKLITKGTIEEKIFELQQRKKEMIDAVIKPGETMLSKMTESEIKALFEL